MSKVKEQEKQGLYDTEILFRKEAEELAMMEDALIKFEEDMLLEDLD